jgi:ABC-2 type transport system permease protein
MNPALAARVFALEVKRVFAYRAEFWMGFLGNAASQFAVAYLLWAAIFAGTGASSMQGFALPDLALYYLLVPLVQRVALGAEMSHISGEIYDGTLTRFLIYPIAFFRFKFVSSLAQSMVYAGQMAVLIVIFLAVFGIPSAFRFSIPGMALCLLAMLAGTLLYFALAACLEMVAFWADNVWSLLVLNRMVLHFLGGGLLPMAFFPEAAQSLLKLTPFPYFTAFPIRFLMGGLPSREIALGFGVMAFWIAALSLLAAWIWRRGMLRYTGVGI